MSKLIITSYESLWIAALSDGNRIQSIDAEKMGAKTLLGDIFIGKIDSISKSLNAAFVEYQSGLRGYLPLQQEASFVYVNGKKRNSPVAGDEVLVQISKEPIRSKEAALTAHLCVTGHYHVIKYMADGRLHFSSKIKNQAWKEHIAEVLSIPSGWDVTVRTEAYEADETEIKKEMDSLIASLSDMIDAAKHRTCYSRIARPQPFYLKFINAVKGYGIEEIVCDNRDLLAEIQSAVNTRCLSLPIRFYEDKLVSLSVLYKVSTAVEECRKRTVWLDSGAFLVIDVTEAMVVVDVNSGKFARNAKKSDMILNVNLEAAKEIFRQLRIRNLSGIIMIDFINMETEEQRQTLMDHLRILAANEKHKTIVVEMTKLFLVEITRKREKRPLYELLNIQKDFQGGKNEYTPET